MALAGCAPPCEDGLVCAVVGTGELGFNGDGLPALETRLASPTAVRVDPAGRVVVVDYSNMRVRVVEEDGTVATIVGRGEHAFSEPGAHPLDSPLENPVDASWGPDGRLYVLPQHEGRVIRVGDDGRVERYAGTGELADGADDLPALDVTMGFGGGMAWSREGDLYVSDSSYSRVRRITPDGRALNVLGTGEAGRDPPGPGPSTTLAFPERVVVDDVGGRLIVADTANHRVLAMDLASLEVSLVAGTGEPGRGEGPADRAALASPVGVEVTPAGGVLIADMENHRLCLVEDGELRTVAGADDAPVREVASPLEVALSRPGGLAWAPDGDLLIAERSGHRVVRWVGARDAL